MVPGVEVESDCDRILLSPAANASRRPTKRRSRSTKRTRPPAA